MLIRSVKPGERIHIGDDIYIDVNGIHGKQVKMGFKAPKNLPIWVEKRNVEFQDE